MQVNGAAAKASQKLRGGEHVMVEARPRPPLRAEAESIPLDIRYEDEDLLVLNKPAGLVCHPTKNGEMSSLIGRARLYLSLDSTAWPLALSRVGYRP